MKLSAIVRAYNDAWHIGNCLNNIYEQLDEIIIIEGCWDTLFGFGFGGYNSRRSTDGTCEIIEKFISDHKDRDIKYVKVEEGPKKEPPYDTYPYYFWDLTGCKVGDYAFIVDTDEIYRKADFKKVADCARSGIPSRMAVWAYNLIGVDTYRSDSYDGPMGIGGRIEKFGEFNTDRYMFGSKDDSVFIVPDIWCFHYSLYKPLNHLKYKCAFDDTLKKHWHLDENNNIVFVDGNKVLKYDGDLPEGYIR